MFDELIMCLVGFQLFVSLVCVRLASFMFCWLVFDLSILCLVGVHCFLEGTLQRMVLVLR